MHTTTTDEFFRNIIINLQNAVPIRFTISDFALAATIVDPAAQHLNAVEDILMKKGISRSKFIEAVMDKLELNVNDENESETTPSSSENVFFKLNEFFFLH